MCGGCRLRPGARRSPARRGGARRGSAATRSAAAAASSIRSSRLQRVGALRGHAGNDGICPAAPEPVDCPHQARASSQVSPTRSWPKLVVRLARDQPVAGLRVDARAPRAARCWSTATIRAVAGLRARSARTRRPGARRCRGRAPPARPAAGAAARRLRRSSVRRRAPGRGTRSRRSRRRARRSSSASRAGVEALDEVGARCARPAPRSACPSRTPRRRARRGAAITQPMSPGRCGAQQTGRGARRRGSRASSRSIVAHRLRAAAAARRRRAAEQRGDVGRRVRASSGAKARRPAAVRLRCRLPRVVRRARRS